MKCNELMATVLLAVMATPVCCLQCHEGHMKRFDTLPSTMAKCESNDAANPNNRACMVHQPQNQQEVTYYCHKTSTCEAIGFTRSRPLCLHDVQWIHPVSKQSNETAVYSSNICCCDSNDNCSNSFKQKLIDLNNEKLEELRKLHMINTVLILVMSALALLLLIGIVVECVCICYRRCDNRDSF